MSVWFRLRMVCPPACGNRLSAGLSESVTGYLSNGALSLGKNGYLP